ncbi:MAG: hypothetical protein RR869_00210 [Lachnospiraceae bacterium]
MSTKKRYAIIMVMGVIMNIALNQIIFRTHIPIWLDMTGTAFAAFMLEPAAGLLVGLANNFILSVNMGSSSSLIYYALSAVTAIIAGCIVKKGEKINAKRILGAMGLIIVITTVLGWMLSIWQSGGVPDGAQELFYYRKAIKAGIPGLASNLLSQFAVKTGDITASAAIIILLYRLLPRSLKEQTDVVDQKTHNPSN